MRDAAQERRASLGEALEQCRPGRTVGDVRNAAGVTVDGVGMGHEELADDDVLEAGIALAIERDAADVLTGATVVVTGDGYVVL